MRKVWALVRRDARNVCRNVISLVVCVGIVIIPSLYAWFNIAGSWDPYSNTHNLKVAVANCDEGYSSELIPVNINIGDRVVSSLRANTKIDYVVVDEQEARDGIEAGRYYAAIVIPADFSADMLSVLSEDADPADLEYIVNEKENAIAPIVTDKATSAVREEIDQTFSETITEVGAGVLSDLDDYLDSDQLAALATQLDTALGSSSSDIRTTAQALRACASLVDSSGTVLDSSAALLGESGTSGEAIGSALDDSASGVRSVGDAITSSTDSINSTLSAGSQSFDEISAAIDTAMDAAKDQSADASAKLKDASGKVEARIQDYRDLKVAFEGQRDALVGLKDALAAAGADTDLVDDAISGTDWAIADCQSAIDNLTELDQGLLAVAANLDQSVADAEATKASLDQLVADAKGSITQVQSDYETNLRTTLTKLASSIDDANGEIGSISGSLSTTVSDLATVTGDAQGGLADVSASLSATADTLDSTADDIDTLRARIQAASASGDMDALRTIIGSDSASLASFLSAPVTIDRTAIYPIANNGSAMAPFYTTLSLFVGAIVLAALVKVRPSDAALEETGARPRHAYFGRLTFFVLLGLMQATLVALGDLFFLGIQCEEPVLFVLSCWFASLVFVNIVYALVVSFGDVGKAIAVFLLVIQVAGSGGTFPVEMLPTFFQNVYPWLPFVHAIGMLRECIGGLFQLDLLLSALRLALFIPASLLLGLLLRKPVVRLNEWVEHSLESTKVM